MSLSIKDIKVTTKEIESGLFEMKAKVIDVFCQRYTEQQLNRYPIDLLENQLARNLFDFLYADILEIATEMHYESAAGDPKKASKLMKKLADVCTGNATY